MPEGDDPFAEVEALGPMGISSIDERRDGGANISNGSSREQTQSP